MDFIFSHRSNESVSSVATSNEYEIVSMNAEPEVDAEFPPEVEANVGDKIVLPETEDEVDLKIVGNGNEAELKVFWCYQFS